MREHKKRLHALLENYSKFASIVTKEFEPGLVNLHLPKKGGLVQGDIVGTVLDLPLEIEVRKEGPLPRQIAERRDFINRSGLFIVTETPDGAIKQIRCFVEARAESQRNGTQ